MNFKKLHAMTDSEKLDIFLSKTAIMRLISEIESEFVGRIQLGEDVKGYDIKQIMKRKTYKSEEEAEPVLVKLFGDKAYKKSLIGLSSAVSILADHIYDTKQERTKKAAKATAVLELESITHRPKSDSYVLVVAKGEDIDYTE